MGFWDKVDQRGPDDCWEWQAYRKPDGYGMAWDPQRKRMVNAHRAAYELANGAVPDGLLVLHDCDNRACCNPVHLFTGTQLDNMADMRAKGREPAVAGEANANARLTAAEVIEIRASHSGRYGEKMEIARRYGISSGHVSKILSGAVWPDA